MKKKIISDVVLNIIASLIPMFILQFYIFPIIATKVEPNIYGQLLSIVAFMNLSAGTLGNVLNNSRLINYIKYDEMRIKGDYSILLLIASILNVIFMIFGVWFYGKTLNIIGTVTIVIASLLLLIEGYARVEFRIKLNFKNILFESIFLLAGYIIGFILFLIGGYWEFIYLCGFASSVLFIILKTDILKEPLVNTTLFKQTTIQTISILLSGLLLSLGTYVDRLLIYPMLGGTAVSIYYTATLIGKSISLVIQPVTGVLLSYFAQLTKFSIKNFRILFSVSIIVGAIGYVLTIFLSEPLLGLLYPNYVNKAMEYIYITTLSTIIIIITNILNSVVLKFCDIRWQLFINIIYMLVYFSSTLILLNLYGLMGFCIGILIASFVKLIAMLVAYYFNNKNIHFLNINTDIKEE